jgi:hypothetical protein
MQTKEIDWNIFFLGTTCTELTMDYAIGAISFDIFITTCVDATVKKIARRAMKELGEKKFRKILIGKCNQENGGSAWFDEYDYCPHCQKPLPIV